MSVCVKVRLRPIRFHPHQVNLQKSQREEEASLYCRALCAQMFHRRS